MAVLGGFPQGNLSNGNGTWDIIGEWNDLPIPAGATRNHTYVINKDINKCGDFFLCMTMSGYSATMSIAISNYGYSVTLPIVILKSLTINNAEKRDTSVNQTWVIFANNITQNSFTINVEIFNPFEGQRRYYGFLLIKN